SAGLYGSYIQAKEERVTDDSFSQKLYKKLSNYGVDPARVTHVAHHLCHAASAYHGLAQSIEEPYLLFTLDGGGDNLRSTVSIGQHGKIERKLAGNEYSIGNI